MQHEYSPAPVRPPKSSLRRKVMMQRLEEEQLVTEEPKPYSTSSIASASLVIPVDDGGNATDPFSGGVWNNRNPQLAQARATFFKTFIPGSILVSITIFAMFSIFWGALWKIPAHPLPGWIVDFDGGDIGQAVVDGLMPVSDVRISWTVIPSTQFPGGITSLAEAVKEEHIWIAVAINEGATRRLEDSITSPNTSYDGTTAVTAFGIEARNENAYRSFLSPAVQTYLEIENLKFAMRLASRLSSAENIASIMAVSPQTVVKPVSYTLVNLLPFSQPVATAASFVGLIFLLIMSFFVVMIANAARMSSGIGRFLTLRSLIVFRLSCIFIVYFFLSLWYALLNLAFKLDVFHTYGKGGFMVFWMGAYVYMLAVGLALESLVVLLKHFVPFFLIMWIIVNVSINLFPPEVLPRVFHYGYGTPFYNFSKIIRTIVFGTKNKMGLHFGVLIAWIAVSCVTLILIQWNARRLEVRDMKKNATKSESH